MKNLNITFDDDEIDILKVLKIDKESWRKFIMRLAKYYENDAE